MPIKKQFDGLIQGMIVEGTEKTLVYRYRGGVERGAGGRYVWHNGYSLTTNDNGILYPWMTKKECIQEASAHGKKAVFVEVEE